MCGRQTTSTPDFNNIRGKERRCENILKLGLQALTHCSPRRTKVEQQASAGISNPSATEQRCYSAICLWPIFHAIGFPLRRPFGPCRTGSHVLLTLGGVAVEKRSDAQASCASNLVNRFRLLLLPHRSSSSSRSPYAAHRSLSGPAD